MITGGPTAARWRKSSHSSGAQNRVEIVVLGDHAAVRDSKKPNHGPLVLAAECWAGFLAAVKAGHLNG
ncbi:DUF397 domain-containing protein [Goodfellowiella coeruleoviolacea]|uniref:DUF397 domain-containing protein n=1 Tax=Goodfellowiella coeruleoviolacea TaxID=334858 RepID=A0AAE3KKX4_9PSEU|nr:DUF397 domain-containing protein [Goodfellowiella coeruleoviolacea]MCP2169819.1 protein of unknown function (DUF397) [Goodfellowiella coeruleoviolacea]